MIARVCGEQEQVSEAIAKRDINGIINAFANDPLVTCSRKDAETLFFEMCNNTRKYLAMYDI